MCSSLIHNGIYFCKLLFIHLFKHSLASRVALLKVPGILGIQLADSKDIPKFFFYGFPLGFPYHFYRIDLQVRLCLGSS